MKSSRKSLCVLVLVLALTSSAFAGDIHHPLAPPPPPGAPSVEIPTGEVVSTPEATDTITEAALNLLQSFLTLF